MVEESKVAKKTVSGKKVAVTDSAVAPAKKATAAKKAPAAEKVVTIESAWPFPAIEKAPKKATVKKTPAVAKPAATKKSPAKSTKKVVEKQSVAQPSAQERYRMVETAAYYIAERAGFGGNAVEHWAQAEIEIAAKLAG